MSKRSPSCLPSPAPCAPHPAGRAFSASPFLLLSLLLACSLAGCGENGNDDEEDDGVGVTHLNGVECFGDAWASGGPDTLYVSPSGDDANAGDSPDAPLRTLAAAFCGLRPGQTVLVFPGTYRESVIMGIFGNGTDPIVIRGVHDNGQRPVLDGEGVRTMGIALVECAGIVVEGLEFRNYTDEGLYALLGSEITIRNNLFTANGRNSIDPDHDGEGFGVLVVGVADVVIEDNEADRNGPSPARVALGILGTGIDTFELTSSVIRGNHSHHNTGGGLLVEDSEDVLVEDNTFDHNELDAGGDWWDGAIWLDGGRHITLRGNRVTDNHGPGIQISDEDRRYPDASYGYVLEENEITGNVFGIFVWNFGVCLPDSTVIRLTDNRIEGNTEQDTLCLEWD